MTNTLILIVLKTSDSLEQKDDSTDFKSGMGRFGVGPMLIVTSFRKNT